MTSRKTAQWIVSGGKRRKVEFVDVGVARVDGIPFRVDVEEVESGVLSLLWTDAEGRTRSFWCVADPDLDGDGVIVDGERTGYSVFDPRSLRGVSASAAESGPKPLKAPMPGRVIRVLVAAGERVAAGQGCVVIEAMKMQNELKAPRAGVVRKLAAVEGETVAAGAVLLVIE